MKKNSFLWFVSFIGVTFCLLAMACEANRLPVIVVAQDSDFRKTLASKEVRRYVFLRTGDWLYLIGKLQRQ